MSYENQSTELFEFEDYSVRASAGKRFLNYIIDLLFFYILAFALVFILAIINPDIVDFLDDDSLGMGLLDRFISLIIYALYMGASESIFKGKSIGKFITRTQAVNLDGSTISTKTAFLRGFSRAVPFAAFSAFGEPSNPWQDRWTDTMVINDMK
jgi:uncharacterized RDD family membrane protein YckC